MNLHPSRPLGGVAYKPTTPPAPQNVEAFPGRLREIISSVSWVYLPSLIKMINSITGEVQNPQQVRNITSNVDQVLSVIVRMWKVH